MHAPRESGQQAWWGDRRGPGGARPVLLPTSGRLALCAVSPLPRAVGRDGAPCLQCLFQPWLTRVRARPCRPPLQDVRPRNCLQLQSASPQPRLPTGTRAPASSARLGAPWGLQGTLTGLPGGCREHLPVESTFFVPDQDETSVSSEDFDMNDSTWMSADAHLASSLSPSQDERMRSPQNLHSQEDGECPSVAGGGGAALDNKGLGIQGGGIWARAPGSGPSPGLQLPAVFTASLRAPPLRSWFWGDQVVPPKGTGGPQH